MNALNRALSDCHQDASDIRADIFRLPDTHPNLYVIVDAIREVVSEVTWGDASDAAASLAEALEHLANVYAMKEAA